MEEQKKSMKDFQEAFKQWRKPCKENLFYSMWEPLLKHDISPRCHLGALTVVLEVPLDCKGWQGCVARQWWGGGGEGGEVAKLVPKVCNDMYNIL